MAKMNWSGPNVIHFGRKSQFGPDHFILVETKSLWSSPNQFGQTKTILDRPKLFWSHRRTRHKFSAIYHLAVSMRHSNCVRKLPWNSIIFATNALQIKEKLAMCIKIKTFLNSYLKICEVCNNILHFALTK